MGPATEPAIELEQGANATLKQTLDYWQHLRGQRRMPSRRDFNPADIPRLLPKLMLADVSGGDTSAKAPEIRFRLVGTEIVSHFGCELTGCQLSEIDYGARAGEIAGLYRKAVACGRPQYVSVEFWQSGDRLMRMQQLLLPLSNDGNSVNMILAVVHCQ